MKFSCVKTCQIRVDGQITFVQRGEVLELDEEPNNGCFVCIETPTYRIDFLKASEAELKKTKWDPKDAYAVINEAYTLELEYTKGDKKADVIENILDARFRAVD